MVIKKIIFTCLLFSAFGVLSQKQLQIPEIEGEPADNVAPLGWAIGFPSPDIIRGNGPWPSGIYHVEDVDGNENSEETMGLFLANAGGEGEGWTTEVRNLKKGEEYTFSIQWQQCTLTDYINITYSGGDLSIMVDNAEQIFQSNGELSDGWQTATVVFTARSETAIIGVKVEEKAKGPQGGYGSAIVIDNSCDICKEAGL